MQFKEAFNKLEQSKEFKDWHQEYPDAFLAHGFILLDELNKDVWQIGYYNKEDDKITTFFVSKDKVQSGTKSEVFKKPDATIKRLDLSKIKVDFMDALDI